MKRERKEEVDSVEGSMLIERVCWRLERRSSIDKCFFCNAASASACLSSEMVSLSISSSIFVMILLVCKSSIIREGMVLMNLCGVGGGEESRRGFSGSSAKRLSSLTTP